MSDRKRCCCNCGNDIRKRMKRAMSIVIVPLMDTESDMSNALNIGADDGRKTANGMVTRMNKLFELLEEERPMIPDSDADYYIGYNNGLVMAQAIVLKHNAVSVVCCADCKNWMHEYDDVGLCVADVPDIDGVQRRACDFCSYGERRTDEREAD